MNSRRWGSNIGILLVGLLIALVIGVLSRKNFPVLIYFIAAALWIGVGIGLEWLEDNKSFFSKQKTTRSNIIFVFGTIPYLAGLMLLAVFVYYSAKVLLGR
jgi:hypothetical protein